jgi:hypothetical protein
VDRAERRVTVLDRLDDDAHGHEVEDVVELAALEHHLFVDAPEMFAASGHLGLDTELAEAGTHLGDRLSQVHLALGAPRGDEMLELGEPLGVQRSERQILELLLDLLDTQPVSERGVDVEGLLCDAALLVGRHGGQGAHVVEPIGQLDHQHPQIAGHGDQHLAHRGGLLRLTRVELQTLELGDAVDDVGHLGAEVLQDVRQRDLGVFDRVVEQCGGHRHLVETDVGDDASNSERMIDVALAARAGLRPMGLGGHLVRAVDGGHRRLGMPPAVTGEQRGASSVTAAVS